MKKITSAVLGFSLALATAGLSLAAQTTNAPANSNSATTTKKHVKKNKKANKPANTNTAASGTAATK